MTSRSKYPINYTEDPMISRLYFLITATDELRTRLAGSSSDVAELLTETRLWSASHADRSNWTIVSRTLAVKLLYLANLRQEYSKYDEYRSVLGNQPITADTFDRWWTVTPLQVDEDFENVTARLNPSVLVKIDKTGMHAVDDWIEELGSSHKV